MNINVEDTNDFLKALVTEFLSGLKMLQYAEAQLLSKGENKGTRTLCWALCMTVSNKLKVIYSMVSSIAYFQAGHVLHGP